MNYKRLVKLSNIIGISSIILLVYWVFIFISITVFGFKVFRENITETFYLSIVGILSLMFGALIINIMFNLTRIAEKPNHDNNIPAKTTSKKFGLLFGLSFPLIFALLYGGDYLTSLKKEKVLVASAQSILESNQYKSNKLLDYTFDKKWIFETQETLELYSNIDESFPAISVIVSDTVAGSQVFLGFRRADFIDLNDTIVPKKKSFIEITSKEEREYLKKVFFKNYKEVHFTANDGKYELFYPFAKDGKKVVLHFSESQRYGKIGS